MRDKSKYNELENKGIEKVKEILKEVLDDRPIKNPTVEIHVGRDEWGDVIIEGVWAKFDYTDSGRYSGFDEAKFLIGRTKLDEITLRSDVLLDEAIDKMVSALEKIPACDTPTKGYEISARTYLKFEAMERGSNVFNTVGTSPDVYKLRDDEKLFSGGKLVNEDKENKIENENHLNDNDHVEPSYDKYRNKRDDDDGGDEGGDGPAAELTPSYDDEEGMEL